MSKSNISKLKVFHEMIYEENNADFAYQNVMKVVSFSFNECFPIGRHIVDSRKSLVYS